MDGFLPPVDNASWLDYQRRRAERFARERIAAAGSGAGDWIGRATQAVDTLIPDWAQPQPPPAPPPPPPEPEPITPISPAAQVGDWTRGALDRIGQIGGDLRAGWGGDRERIRREREAVEHQFPTAAETGPAGFTLPQTGTPEGERITTALAETAMEQTPGGRFVTDATRLAARVRGFDPNLPMTAGTGVPNALQTGLGALGSTGLVSGAVQELGREALQRLPGGETSVFEGAPLPGGNRLTRDTPVLGGLTTPDELLPFLAGARLNDPEDVTRLLGQGRGLVGAARRFGTGPDPTLGIVKRETYDPFGFDPEKGRLAARGRPGRAPGPAAPGPLTAEQQALLERKGLRREDLTAEPFPPGPGPKGEYTIPHPTGPTMVAAPPPPNTYLTSDGYVFWKRVTSGQSPYRHDYARSVRELQQPKYPWDVYTSPPPAPGSPGYGRLDQAPLAAPDWDTRLAGWTPPRGTDPTTLRHLLNRYAMHERFPEEAVADLAPSHPDLATPEGRQAALDDLNAALTQARARRSKNEDRAIASERNVRKERAPSDAEDGGEPDAGDGVYSYRSVKGVTPDGEVGGEFHLTSSYEVASAMKFDQDPNVVSYQKGAGPRGRVRLVIDPKYGYNPTDEFLMRNSDPGPGSEVIYSPDWLVTFRDGSQKVVETKNLGITDLPAWRIAAKTQEGQRHFEDLWGVGFMMMAEDQLGRPFLRELATADLARLPADHPLHRVRATDVADLQRKLLSASKASRGTKKLAEDERLMRAAQHIMDLNSRSKYPASADLDDTRNVEQYLSAARAQAEWHNTIPGEGTTFSVDGQNIPLAPGLGGYMVSVTPPSTRISYPGHRIHEYRLAQFRHENALVFDMIPDARVGTFKWTDDAGRAFTDLDVSIRAPDGISAAQIANLFRQRAVYNIDAVTVDPVRPRNWVGQNAYTEKAAHEQLRRILDDATTRALGGERDVGVFPDLRGLDLTGAPQPPAPGLGRGRPDRAAAGRGASLPGVLGADTRAAQRAGVLGAGRAVQPAPGAELRSAEAPGLPADGRGSAALGGPGGPGIAAQPGFGDALQRALRSVEPYGAARTQGERAFDVTGGTLGAIGGAASAEEDATWQERARRAAAGAVAGSLVGPTARGALGLAARNGDVLGAAAGAVAERGGAAAPAVPPGPGRGRLAWSDIPELMGSIPLASPTSQLTNFTSGMARTLERVAGVAFEGRPIDALVDLAGMARSLPGAGKRLAEAFRTGPTQWNPGVTGAQTSGDVLGRGGILPNVLTVGTRANAAMDEFWRAVNEAGAGARAARNKLGAADTARLTQSAGDFATWGGPNSALAKKLTELKGAVRDPNASALDKGIAAGVTSFAPYIMMPERLLRATIGNLIPVEAAVGMVRAIKRGDKAAAREFRGRMLAGMAATTALTYAYYQGAITGDPPRDANERRRREAQGARWNTIAVPGGGRIPTRALGSLGMQADAIATTLDGARRAVEKGGDPGAVLENGYNAAWRWALDASYLSDLADFAENVQGPQGAAGATRQLLAGQPSRFTGPITNVIGAADPYERQAETFPEQVANRTGLRFLSPTRIDPTTGQDQRREGTGWSRYWGERGSVQSDEAVELARLGVQPRVLSRTEEFEGAKQTPEQRRLAQRALGSETNRAVREVLAKPDYAGLTDEEKKSRLQTALRRAAEEADVVLSEQVARGPKQQAQRAWDAVPKYVGVQGTPDEIRRENARISRAKSLASQYREKYGEGPWRSKMAQEEPEAYKLVTRPGIASELLKRRREALEKQYGVTLS